MAVPAGGAPALILTGDVTFLAGGLPVSDLTGAFVKSINSESGSIVLQQGDGLEIILRFAKYRNDAPVASTAYIAGDWVHIPTDLSIQFCVIAGDYTRAEIIDSNNWRNISGRTTDDDLDVDDPSNEPTDEAPSRQAVAEVVQEAERQVISGKGGPPQAAEIYNGTIFVDLNGLELLVCSNVPHNTAESTGDFEAISDGPTITDEEEYGNYPAATEDDFLYAAFADHFYNGVTVGVGRVAWVQDTASDALASNRNNNSFAVHWLGHASSDDDAAALIGELEGNTDYFYYNPHGETIQRLDRTSFTEAGGTVDHWNWAPPAAEDSRRRIFDARSGILPPIPQDGTGDERIGLGNDGFHIVDVENAPATDASVNSWADYTDTDYEGALRYDPFEPVGDGHYWYNIQDRTWREQYTDQASFIHNRDRNPPDNWIGHYASRQDALNHAAERGIAAGDDFIAYTGHGNRRSGKVEEATDLTLGTGGRILRRWIFVPAAGFQPGPPTAIYWGVGQTERWPSNFPNIQTGAGLRRMQFASGTLPHEDFDGGGNALGDIFVAGASVSTDIDSGDPARATERVVFTLPAGRYHIFVKATQRNDNAEFDTDISLSIRRISPGDDDVVIGETPSAGAGTTTNEDIRRTYDIAIRNLVVAGTEQFYLTFAEVGLGENADNTRHYMEIERVG